jgi:hypothetical protein
MSKAFREHGVPVEGADTVFIRGKKHDCEQQLVRWTIDTITFGSYHGLSLDECRTVFGSRFSEGCRAIVFAREYRHGHCSSSEIVYCGGMSGAPFEARFAEETPYVIGKLVGSSKERLSERRDRDFFDIRGWRRDDG